MMVKMVRGDVLDASLDDVRNWGYYSGYDKLGKGQMDDELAVKRVRRHAQDQKDVDRVVCSVPHAGGRPPAWCQDTVSGALVAKQLQWVNRAGGEHRPYP